MARKISAELRRAWKQNETRSIDNSQVTITRTGSRELYLFGNLIAVQVPAVDGLSIVRFTLAGWNTTTTRNRLNQVTDVPVSTRKGVPVVAGTAIDSDQWYRFDTLTGSLEEIAEPYQVAEPRTAGTVQVRA